MKNKKKILRNEIIYFVFNDKLFQETVDCRKMMFIMRQDYLLRRLVME